MEEIDNKKVTEVEFPVMQVFKDSYIIKEKRVFLDTIEILGLCLDGCILGRVDYEIKKYWWKIYSISVARI